MNRYFRAIIDISFGLVKRFSNKILNQSSFHCGKMARIAPSAELIIHRNGKMRIGSYVRFDSRTVASVQSNAQIEIGDRVSFGVNNMIICHQNISIGNDVQFSPNVLVYDHDHDFRAPGGVRSMKFRTTPVRIGSNVWIGANTVILRGTTIGDNCVIAAGSVVKGTIPDGTVLIQKRENILVEN